MATKAMKTFLNLFGADVFGKARTDLDYFSPEELKRRYGEAFQPGCVVLLTDAKGACYKVTGIESLFNSKNYDSYIVEVLCLPEMQWNKIKNMVPHGVI